MVSVNALQDVGVVADNQVGPGIDRRPRRGHLRLARLLDVLIAAVEDDDDQIDFRPQGSHVGADPRRVGPGQAGGAGRGRPRLGVEVGDGLDRHVDVAQEADAQPADVGHVRRVGGVVVGPTADGGHAGRAQQVDALQKRFRPEVQGVVVGQRDEIDAGQGQRLGRFGRRLEGIALGRRRAHVTQRGFQIGDGVVGGVENGLDAGEGVDVVAGGQDDLALGAVDVDVADGRQANRRQGSQCRGQRRGQRRRRRLAARRGDQRPRLDVGVAGVGWVQTVDAQRLAVGRHGAPGDDPHQVVAAGQDGLGLGGVEQLPVGREGHSEGQRLAANDDTVLTAAHGQPGAPLAQGGGRVVGRQQG